MTRRDFIEQMLHESGVITAEENGHSTCTCCGAVGERYEESIRHRKSCRFWKAVSSIASDIPENEHKPGLETRLTIGMLLPYYAELSADESALAERLSYNLTTDMTKKERMKAVTAILDWSPLADGGLLKAAAEHGISGKAERVTVRNYIVFKRVQFQRMMQLNELFKSIVDAEDSIGGLFGSLFTKKYGLSSGRKKTK